MRFSLLLLIAVVFAAMACTSTETAASCDDGAAWVEYQLFMGRNAGAEEIVTDEAWRTFLADAVTPRFPDGLTVLDANGQWRGSDDEILRERSKVLLILAPPGDEPLRLINEISDEYSSQFRQDSVLLTTKDACVSFG